MVHLLHRLYGVDAPASTERCGALSSRDKLENACDVRWTACDNE